jgi:hypothetical protein
MTTTLQEVRAMFERYASTMEEAAAVPDGCSLVLSEGSQTCGRAWRVHLTGGEFGSGHANPMVGPEYLGWTRREAYLALFTATTTVSGLLRMRESVR